MTQRIMRPRKTITVFALALLLFQTTGCYSFRPLESPLPGTREGGGKDSRTVRVITNGGGDFKLREAWMDSLSIGGARKGRMIWDSAVDLEIPLTVVSAIEEEQFNFVRTSLLVLVPIAVVIIGAQATNMSMTISPGGSE